VTDDDLERLLAETFDARARSAVGDCVLPPAPRFTQTPARRSRRAIRVLAPLAAAAAVLGIAVAVTDLGDSSHDRHQAVGHQTGSATTQTSATPTAGQHAEPAAAVHIKLLNADGSSYGVGMPVVALFSRAITNGKVLQDATTATVNGKPLSGGWYFETSNYYKGYPIEAHWRPQTYWPAHAKVHVAIPAEGLSGGKGLAFDDSLTLDFSTGPRNISSVNDVTHRMTVTTDGKRIGVFPVSLGASRTPTSQGTKVIMEKGASICMSGPGYHECGIKYTQRLTYGGEYLHSAPWNVANIERGIDSSNGCTNLMPADAATLFHTLEVGDVVEYPNADGPKMQLGSGYGDWDVPWSTWQTGGLVPTR
jgi:lipoprotein-anchoring transpeptidase ErfK/SrfK